MKKWLLFLTGCILSFLSFASPLPVNEAFQPSIKQIDPNNFVIIWQIKPGYFLYKDRITLSCAKNNPFHLGDIRFPAALTKTDQQGRTYPVYRSQLTLPVAVLGEEAGEAVIELHYQGCADDGFCYPPQKRAVQLTINDHLALTNISLSTEEKEPEAISPSPENDEMAAVFMNHHWLMVFLIFYGFGLLLAFTPCVLPMVPVLSGIIVGHGHTISTRKAFFLSLSYVLSMAVTYAAAGSLVALLGSNLQVIMQSAWSIGLFSLLFVLLALSMFGYFELKLPLSWQAKLAKANRSHGSGHYISAAIMGALSTLILSPCVTAPLIGALGYIAHSGNVLMGACTLFFLGLGMGTPLLLIGTSAGKWLPKAGVWMNAVKSFFGLLLLVVAIHLLSRILPDLFIMILWAVLLTFSGIYSGALTPSHSRIEKFHQAAGIIFLTYGLLILIGASMGSTNPLQPLAPLFPQNTALLSVATDHWIASNKVDDALKEAKGKPVMIDFYAKWCSSCKMMEETLFKDPDVLSALNDFVILKVDITANDAQDKFLLKEYDVIAPPAFLFFNKDGQELSSLRLVGDIDKKTFLSHLAIAANNS